VRLKWQNADWVVAGSAALLAIIFGIYGFLTWQGYGSVLHQAEDRAAAAAKVVSAQARWLAGGQFSYLDHLAGSEAKAYLAGASSGVGPDVTVYNAEGRPLNPPVLGAPEDLATLDIYTKLKNGAPRAIGSEVSDPSIVLASRIVSASGEFAGAVVSVVPRAALEEVWNSLKLGADSTVGLMRSDGIVVARFPPATSRIDLAKLPIYETLIGAPSGTYASPVSPVDGIARVVGFEHVEDLGLVAIAGVSQTAALNGLWSAVTTVNWLLGPIALALFVGAFLTARLLRRSEATRNRLADALAHNEVLFREIHHRVKNNLQSVNAILHLQPIPREVKEEMARRLSAMSAVHEHIYRSDTFGSVDLAAYLTTLVADVRKSATEVQITERYDPIRVPSDLATPLGLIVNEVISNCIKHAFPDGRNGLIAVTLHGSGTGRAMLSVADDGVGYDPTVPRKGIGQKLITALSKQAGGEPRFTSENGTRFEIDFPVLSSETTPI